MLFKLFYIYLFGDTAKIKTAPNCFDKHLNISLTMVTLQKWYLFAAFQKQVDLSDLYVRTQSFTIIWDTV